MDYILREAAAQQEAGAHILDVNVGLPDLDEAAMMRDVIGEIQSITSLPLQIDTVDPAALEAGMRMYNGKPMINSVNGKQESMEQVFPLVKKYGGVVVGLTLDETGIPDTAEGGRTSPAGSFAGAAAYGIEPKDIVIDVLAMTISSDPAGAGTTLEALRLVRERYGVRTVLGVSNISFGLPRRPVINAGFYTMALMSGLTAGIINPASEDMMGAYFSYRALMEYDVNCGAYIRRFGQEKELAVSAGGASAGAPSLKGAIRKGLKEDAAALTAELLKEEEPLAIIDGHLIPALDEVGKGFEKGTVFLPQLLMSADAAQGPPSRS